MRNALHKVNATLLGIFFKAIGLSQNQGLGLQYQSQDQGFSFVVKAKD